MTVHNILAALILHKYILTNKTKQKTNLFERSIERVLIKGKERNKKNKEQKALKDLAQQSKRFNVVCQNTNSKASSSTLLPFDFFLSKLSNADI